jgi:hypothetical protein
MILEYIFSRGYSWYVPLLQKYTGDTSSILEYWL